MKKQYAINILIISIIVITGIFTTNGQSTNRMYTSGEVTFTVKTITDNGNFAPKHVLAIWVEDDQGFVKTSKLRANQRKQYLYTWKSVSNNNVVDAVTGATISSHQTHSITWNCTDVDGNVVPDGDYTIFVEFTEKHAQGPLASVTFIKGTDEQHLTPPDENNFENISLDYIPETTGLTDVTEKEMTVYPNPGNGLFTINLPFNKTAEIIVFNSAGQIIIDENKPSNSDQIIVDLTSFEPGVYFIEVRQLQKRQMVKIIKQ